MTTPRVTEIPPRLEPVTPDRFDKPMPCDLAVTPSPKPGLKAP